MKEFIKSTVLGGAIFGILSLLLCKPVVDYAVPAVFFIGLSFALGFLIREAIRESRAND